MKQINVIIAERDRGDCLSVCLYHLNAANLDRLYNVDVYVVSDRKVNSNTVCNNINVHLLFFPTLSKYFNKAVLLNYGLEIMKPVFDWVSIVDVDMIYDGQFFRTVDHNMSDRSYIVCTGTQTNSNCVYPGASQISMSSLVYKLFTTIYKDKLYCENFVGWGGEDSDVSLRSIDLKKAGLIDRKVIRYMWLHIDHSKREENKAANYELFLSRRRTNQELLRRWLDR
jgi:hypothetical protein